MKEVSTFTFGPEFQDVMLAMMIDDLSFADKVLKFVPKDRLYSIGHKWLFELFQKKMGGKGTIPSLPEAEDALKEMDASKRRLIHSFIKRIYKDTKIKDPDYIKDQLTDYSQKNAFIECFMDAQSLWNAKRHRDAFILTLEGVQELHAISFHDDTNILIGDFETHRQKYMLKSLMGLRRIPTLVGPLDDLLNGGLEKGEFAIILADPKKGKSIGLIHMGCAALMTRNGRVAHFVLEGTTEQTLMRYLARLTRIPYNSIARDELTPEQSKKLKSIKAKYTDRLELVPMNKHWDYTVLDIESKVKEMMRAGNKPDLIVIDYADLLKSNEKFNEKRHEQTAVYRQLKQLSMIHECAIWTASQAIRPKDAPEKEALLRAKDVSECIERDSLVLTEDGYVPIQEIEVGTKVLTHLGNWKRVTKKWNRGEKETISIRPFGRLPKRVTPDHKFFDGNDFVEAKDVSRVFMPKFSFHTKKGIVFDLSKITGFQEKNGMCGIKNKRIYYGSRSYRNGKFSTKTPPLINRIPLDEDVAWVLGFFLAEGCVCADGRTCTLTSSKYIDLAANILSEKFGVTGVIRDKGGYKEWRVTNIILNSFLRFMIGSGAKTKIINPIILRSDFATSFAKGVYDGDGYVKHKRLSLSNKKAIFDLMAIHHSTGKACFVNMCPNEGYDPTYVLSWSEVGQHSLPSEGGHTYSQRKVSDGGVVEVWDLEVEDDHSFIVEGMAVHNCYEKVRIADLIMTLNQTSKEKQEGIVRLHLDIYRSNDFDKTIRMITDYSRMIFYSKRYQHIEGNEIPSWTKTRTGRK